jgi:hypothetical protein
MTGEYKDGLPGVPLKALKKQNDCAVCTDGFFLLWRNKNRLAWGFSRDRNFANRILCGVKSIKVTVGG